MSDKPKSNKPLTCPQCGGQNLTINQHLIYARDFSIEDGKMYRVSEPKIETHGDTWIDCNTCREEELLENNIEVSEWMASKEELDIIWLMKQKRNQGTDVSEFLNDKDK
jgi:hypothetical protein